MEISPTTSHEIRAFAESFRRGWYGFRRNPTALVGLVIVGIVVFMAVFAPFAAPYPQHAGKFVDFANASRPPSFQHPFGTDVIGRDILSRVIFGYRFSLTLGSVVLSIAVPVGVILGLIAGYFRGIAEILIMRVTDIFLSIPPLVLALAIMAVLKPNLFNAMIAVSLMWWPWYTRMIYSITSSVRNEHYIQAAEVIGASRFHILFREILPNCTSSIFTKMTLDMGYVILIGASLSFLGLGVQPPQPGLGTMVAAGAKFLPDLWWMSIFPALAILLVILGFNLLGDGLRDMFDVKE